MQGGAKRSSLSCAAQPDPRARLPRQFHENKGCATPARRCDQDAGRDQGFEPA